MNQTEFLYWLQGMLEYADFENMTGPAAVAMLEGIKDHLELIFKKVTPSKKVEPSSLSKEDIQKILDTAKVTPVPDFPNFPKLPEIPHCPFPLPKQYEPYKPHDPWKAPITLTC